MDKTNWTNEYRTGRMRPRKPSKGVVSAVLMAVIFFGGILTGLGLLNVRPFRQLQDQPRKEEVPLSFYKTSGQDSSSKVAVPDAHLARELGLYLREISLVSQKIHRLPRGLYITQVANDTDAAVKGILPGDVLTALGGEEIASLNALRRLLFTRKAGDAVEAQIYRNGQSYQVELIIHPADTQ